MFKVVINDGKSELPNDDIFYIVAKGGIYLKKRMGVLESIAPVDKISILEDISPEATLHVKKIPAERFAKVLEFFKTIYKLKKSEACVLLHYHQNKKRYIIQVPPQEVSYGGIDYLRNILYNEYDLIGSIHSHGNMSAFHSGIDHMDEKYFDGLHITIGDVADQFISISASIMSNGHRFIVNPTEYIDGLNLVEYTPWWPTMFKPNFTVVEGEKHYNSFVKTRLGYTVLASKKDRKFDKRWIGFVKLKKSSYTHYTDLTALYSGLTQSFESPTKRTGVASLINTRSKDQRDNSYNPCSDCMFRNFKIDLTLKDILETESPEEVSFEPDFIIP